MLAYKHKLNVDALQRLKEQAQQQIERVRLQKFMTQAGVIDDGSELETAKRKTSFLLRHFFSLENEYVKPLWLVSSLRSSAHCVSCNGCYRASPQQERLLYDIVEDWRCAEAATPTELSKLWASITNHIEQSCEYSADIVWTPKDLHDLLYTVR